MSWNQLSLRKCRGERAIQRHYSSTAVVEFMSNDEDSVSLALALSVLGRVCACFSILVFAVGPCGGYQPSTIRAFRQGTTSGESVTLRCTAKLLIRLFFFYLEGAKKPQRATYERRNVTMAWIIC